MNDDPLWTLRPSGLLVPTGLVVPVYPGTSTLYEPRPVLPPSPPPPMRPEAEFLDELEEVRPARVAGCDGPECYSEREPTYNRRIEEGFRLLEQAE